MVGSASSSGASGLPPETGFPLVKYDVSHATSASSLHSLRLVLTGMAIFLAEIYGLDSDPIELIFSVHGVIWVMDKYDPAPVQRDRDMVYHAGK